MERMLDLQEQLLSWYNALNNIQELVIAYSGGLDSTVLLHSLLSLELGTPIKAVHINHGINDQANEFEAHALSFCNRLQVELTVKRFKIDIEVGESVEAKARLVRYQALLSMCPPNSHLLTAHHLEDQAETVLMRLAQGVGLKGARGIKAMRVQKGVQIHRPLIDITKESIRAYAENHSLIWCEDKSNQQMCFRRNQVRKAVIPALNNAYPNASKSIAKTARLLDEAFETLQYYCEDDLKQMVINNGLDLNVLRKRPKANQRLLLRAFIEQNSFDLPNWSKLDCFLEQALTAKEDKNPFVRWSGGCLYRYHQKIFFLEKPYPTSWQCVFYGTDIDLPYGRKLYVKEARGQGLRKGNIIIRDARPGDKIRLGCRSNRTRIKDWMQQNQIAKPLRSAIPLVELDGKLVGIVDNEYDYNSCVSPDEIGYTFSFSPA